jgi:hypothetical protein
MNQEIEKATQVVKAYNNIPENMRTLELRNFHTRALIVIKLEEIKSVNRLYTLMTFCFDEMILKEKRKWASRIGMRMLRGKRGKPYGGENKQPPMTNAERQRKWRENNPQQYRENVKRQNRQRLSHY